MILYIPDSLIDTCKIILKHKIKGLTRGTHEHAEILDLGKAIHCLEKLQRFQKLNQQAMLDLIASAEAKGVLTKDAKKFLLSGMTQDLNRLNLQIENEFTKVKS